MTSSTAAWQRRMWSLRGDNRKLNSGRLDPRGAGVIEVPRREIAG
jgi:hypothetical protein